MSYLTRQQEYYCVIDE